MAYNKISEEPPVIHAKKWFVSCYKCGKKLRVVDQYPGNVDTKERGRIYDPNRPLDEDHDRTYDPDWVLQNHIRRRCKNA